MSDAQRVEGLESARAVLDAWSGFEEVRGGEEKGSERARGRESLPEDNRLPGREDRGSHRGESAGGEVEPKPEEQDSAKGRLGALAEEEVKPSLTAGFEEYLQQTRGSLHTVHRYARDAEQFAAFIAARPVSVPLVEEWASNQNHGARRPQTVRRKLAAVRAFLAWRGAHGDAGAMETLAVLVGGYRVTPPVRQADVRIVEPATEEDYRRARLSALPECRALLDLLWLTGARISEILGDAVAGIPALTVADGTRLVRDGHTQTVGKGKKIRRLVLPRRGREGLGPYVEARAAQVQEGAPLFRVSYPAAWRMLRAAGAPHPHAFRHSYRARLRRAGVHDQVARALLGHGPHDVTGHYGKVSIEEMVSAAERL